MTDSDTIAAISTPIGSGGVGIVRISGGNAFGIIREITGLKHIKSHTISYTKVLDKDGRVIDEVLVSVMVGPRSYTCEDVAEINCHGGIVSLRRVLERVLMAGARPAEPGEFTKRAFLNGRIDLSQAEAVMDIITATTRLSHRAAMTQAQGSLSGKVSRCRDEILSMLAHIEASVDYPDADMEPVDLRLLREKTNGIITVIENLLATADRGKLLRDGIETVIIGRPNVGKSSLLNAILDEERAIVTDIPGTTRDTLSEYADIDGIPLKITDTAGIRQSEDQIELIGIDRALSSALNADLILFVADISEELNEEDLSILDKLKDKKVIVLLNKSDLPGLIKLEALPETILREHILEVSIKYRNGLDKLYEAISNLFFSGAVTHENDDILSNARHCSAMRNAAGSLVSVLQALDMGMPEDLLAIDLTDAYRYLGEITGETLDEDIIDRIFSDFCLGK